MPDELVAMMIDKMVAEAGKPVDRRGRTVGRPGGKHGAGIDHQPGRVLRAGPTNGIEALEREAVGIDRAVAAGTGSLR